MSSPHVAGAGDPAEGRSTRLDAGPDQVGADDHGDDRTSSRRTATTPADPFDIGAGRIDLTRRRRPRPHVRRDRRADMSRTGQRPGRRRSTSTCRRSTRPSMPGRADDHPDRHQRHRRRRPVRRRRPRARRHHASRSRPSTFTLAPASRRRSTITITSRRTSAASRLRRDPARAARRGPRRRCTCRWRSSPTQGDVTLAQRLRTRHHRRCASHDDCTVTAQNDTFDADVGRPDHDASTDNLRITARPGRHARRGAARPRPRRRWHGTDVRASRRSAPGERRPGTSRSTRSASLPTPIGDEELVNFNVPAFVYNGVTYTTDRRRLQRLPRRRRR